MDKVESVAHNDERKLVRQFSLFQEILYSLSIIAVTFSANSTDRIHTAYWSEISLN